MMRSSAIIISPSPDQSLLLHPPSDQLPPFPYAGGSTGRPLTALTFPSEEGPPLFLDGEASVAAENVSRASFILLQLSQKSECPDLSSTTTASSWWRRRRRRKRSGPAVMMAAAAAGVLILTAVRIYGGQGSWSLRFPSRGPGAPPDHHHHHNCDDDHQHQNHQNQNHQHQDRFFLSPFSAPSWWPKGAGRGAPRSTGRGGGRPAPFFSSSSTTSAFFSSFLSSPQATIILYVTRRTTFTATTRKRTRRRRRASIVSSSSSLSPSTDRTLAADGADSTETNHTTTNTTTNNNHHNDHDDDDDDDVATPDEATAFPEIGAAAYDYYDPNKDHPNKGNTVCGNVANRTATAGPCSVFDDRQDPWGNNNNHSSSRDSTYYNQSSWPAYGGGGGYYHESNPGGSNGSSAYHDYGRPGQIALVILVALRPHQPSIGHFLEPILTRYLAQKAPRHRYHFIFRHHPEFYANPIETTSSYYSSSSSSSSSAAMVSSPDQNNSSKDGFRGLRGRATTGPKAEESTSSSSPTLAPTISNQTLMMMMMIKMRYASVESKMVQNLPRAWWWQYTVRYDCYFDSAPANASEEFPGGWNVSSSSTSSSSSSNFSANSILSTRFWNATGSAGDSASYNPANFTSTGGAPTTEYTNTTSSANYDARDEPVLDPILLRQISRDMYRILSKGTSRRAMMRGLTNISHTPVLGLAIQSLSLASPSGPPISTPSPPTMAPTPSVEVSPGVDPFHWDSRQWLGLYLLALTCAVTLGLNRMASCRRHRQMQKQKYWKESVFLATEEGLDDLLNLGWHIENEELHIYDKSQLMAGWMGNSSYERKRTVTNADDHDDDDDDHHGDRPVARPPTKLVKSEQFDTEPTGSHCDSSPLGGSQDLTAESETPTRSTQFLLQDD